MDLNSKMNQQSTLQNILFGQFTPPLVSKTRRHTILYAGGPQGKPYKPPKVKPNEMLLAADKFYEIIKQHPGICCNEAAAMLKKSPSRVYPLRDILFDQNRIVGVRGKPQRRGGPKTTLFYVKEQHAG